MSLIKKYTIGADIECFAQNEQQNFVTVEGIIKGTKENPFVFDPNNKFFSTQLDNVAAEFTIPPVTTKRDFLKNIMRSKNYIEEALKQEGLSTVFVPAGRFGEEQLVTPSAKAFGCEPDNNAWNNGLENEREEAGNTNLRTAGFHVHIGYQNPSIQANLELMKFFDTFVTMPAILIEPDNERRQLYGAAGAMRMKPYGMEARTLSSYFASTKPLISWVFDQTKTAIKNLNEYESIDNELGKFVQDTINNNDKKKAKELCEKLNIKLIAA